ncbi:MAG: DUF3847 domain-containing protein [Clostridia bacterium]|nr:DUF3847 domain-containing protein [Clostridia bacterium]
MNKTIEKLKAEKVDLEKQIDQITHKKARIDNRIRYLTKGERNKRTHHLCTRMGFIEHCIPELKDLTEAEFCDLFDHLLNLSEVRSMIDKAIVSHHHRAGKGGE